MGTMNIYSTEPKKINHIAFCMLIASTFFLTALGTAQAQKITPNEVVQAAQVLIEEIKLVQHADGVEVVIPSTDTKLPPRKPRHVLQKGRELFRKIQFLRQINGLPKQDLEAFPVRAVAPRDVLEIVKVNLAAFQELKTVYHVTDEAASVPLPTNMKPTDAYIALDMASKLLDQTDIPAVVPNDVYRLALTLNSDLEILVSALGGKGKINVQKRMSGKSPTDVYIFGQKLHARLKEIAEKNDKLKVPGGIALLAKRTSKVSPADVIDLLNNMLGDVSAMKLSLGTKAPTVFAPEQTGKTPSNVLDSLIAAFRHTRDL